MKALRILSVALTLCGCATIHNIDRMGILLNKVGDMAVKQDAVNHGKEEMALESVCDGEKISIQDKATLRSIAHLMGWWDYYESVPSNPIGSSLGDCDNWVYKKDK